MFKGILETKSVLDSKIDFLGKIGNMAKNSTIFPNLKISEILLMPKKTSKKKLNYSALYSESGESDVNLRIENFAM